MVTGRSSTSSIKPQWIGTQRNKQLSRLLLSAQNSSLRGLLLIRSSNSERLFVISAFLFEKRATFSETTRPLSMPRRLHMPNYTRNTTLYHFFRGSCFQICYNLPSAGRVQPCQHSQQALGLCFGMANRECPSICSRRYMGSFR
jgi:hypothetical protein